MKSGISYLVLAAGLLGTAGAHAEIVTRPVMDQTGQAFLSHREDFSPGRHGNAAQQWFYGGSPVAQTLGDITRTDRHQYALGIKGLQVYYPVLGTRVAPQFTGDFLKRKVVGMSLETKVHGADFGELRNRPMSLLLSGPNGIALYKSIGHCLPDQNDNDCMAPALPDTLTTISFRIPTSAAAAIKEGWRAINLAEIDHTIRLDDRLFKTVLSNVQSTNFVYAEPKRVYFLQNFDVDTTAVTVFTKSRTAAEEQ